MSREYQIPVSELQERVSAREFTEWQVFSARDPSESVKEDYRLAVLLIRLEQLAFGLEAAGSLENNLLTWGWDKEKSGGDTQTLTTAAGMSATYSALAARPKE